MFKRPMFAILLIFAAIPALAAAPASNQPQENPNVPIQFGSGQAGPLVPMPPHLPKYLPNGAPNLDEDWIEDGCARLYWNDVIIPQQLRMNGAYWIDPALVPQLLPDKSPAPRRYYKRRSVKRVVHKSTAPPKAGSTSLKSPAIPLPVSPGAGDEAAAPQAPAQTNIPPLTSASRNRTSPHRAPARAQAARTQPAQNIAAANPGDAEDITITPPPLQ